MNSKLIAPAAGIYKIANTTNGHCYIGSSVNIPARVSQHKLRLNAGKSPCTKLQRAWSKHGESSFEFMFMERCAAEREELLKREQHYLDTLTPFYNVLTVAGSRAGSKNSAEQNEKIRIAHVGMKHSEESKRKISRNRSGIPAWNKGIPMPEDRRAGHSQKIKEAVAGLVNPMQGKKHTDEARMKIKAARARQILKPVSDETRAKMSAARKARLKTVIL